MQLAPRIKYLPCYSKRLIFNTVVRSVMSRTYIFHNNQPTKVPVSVTYVDTNERNCCTGTVLGDSGAIDGSTETLIDRWFTMRVALDRL